MQNFSRHPYCYIWTYHQVIEWTEFRESCIEWCAFSLIVSAVKQTCDYYNISLISKEETICNIIHSFGNYTVSILFTGFVQMLALTKFMVIYCLLKCFRKVLDINVDLTMMIN